MSGPKHARTTSKGRTYTHPLTGETAWSVSTIIGGGVPKPALTYWAARSVAEFAVANHRQLDAMLAGVTLRKSADGYLVVSDPNAAEAAIDWMKGAPWRAREKAADIGTAIHAEIEAHILGTPRPDVTPDLAPRMEQFRLFEKLFEPEWMAAEATVWNRTESYAGTLDWIARIGRKVVIGDTKSGKDVYPEVGLQLAAYARGEFVLLPDGSEEPLPALDGACVLHLTDDAYRLVPVRIDDDVFKAFLYAREVFRFQDEISKTVLGGELVGADGIDWTFASTLAAAA